MDHTAPAVVTFLTIEKTYVQKVIDSDTSNITKVEYDKEGNIENIKKGLNSWNDSDYSEETYAYDELGRLELTKDPEVRETLYEYDNNGNLVSETDRNGVVTSYRYDGLNRVIYKENSKDGKENAVQVTYDLLGNRVKMSDSSGTTVNEYDSLGRLVQTKYEGSINQYYEYDSTDRITGIKVLQGSLEHVNIQNGYDKNGRLIRVNEKGRNYSYRYDAIGRLVEEHDGITGISTDYSYYNSGSIKSMSHVSGDTILDSFRYSYDQRGNQVEKDENGVVTKYYYDPLSRLKTVLLSDDGVIDYRYDDLSNISGAVEVKGNKISETSYLYDRNSRLLLTETAEGDRNVEQRFSYDLEGNLKTKEEAVKHSGNLAANKKFEYIFNGYNQLEKVITPDDRIAEYIYNGDGLRAAKGFDDEVISYYYDRGNILLETSNNEVTAKNIRGNRLIYRETDAGIYSYLHNTHGDVVKLLNENSDVIKDYTYDPYGMEEVNSSNSFGNSRFTDVWQQEVEKVDNPFRYAGEYLDDETGLYYLRARYYDPNIGRFISEDSYPGEAKDPLSLNLYVYCYNNPINFFDPSGHIPTPIEAAFMAENIYTAEKGKEYILSGGWKFEDIITDGDNMKMGVYSRVKDDGTTEYALVNKGTTPTNVSDWKNNFQQLFGLSADMKVSIKKSNEFVDNHSGYEITMVGHSKGGAEAAANALSRNKNSIIFNPATVNPSAYGLDSSNYTANMTAFIVKGDALNATEGGFSKPIGKAVYLPQQYGGNWYQLWQTNKIQRIMNHMMSAVKEALKEAGYN
ncbi:tRNA(Glu)-specific nuclease WapA precursor [Oxobacter pfennigii]|uniref:tRNA(Glu)-specific nuclease WapA n=1 Tax=Oxobacter pfennigii TaxID=36849 RepID=A0A0P9AAS7_9CLOT|nr:RHS repeat-associated core domain-containing protein [Oxobacter pfennigii]KPU42117.1 tRNA(Glu)-specific nuclease WapA precursor [Oxobacter pfennigii]